MNDVAIEFDQVWKKFRRGERHDSLRDTVPALLAKILRRRRDDLRQREFWALQDVSLHVGRGEAIGVIGSNGAGKSTMLKILSGILRPNRGHVGIRGRLSALIEVGAGFHPDLTGRENVYLNASILGMGRREIAAKLEEIIEFAGVREFIDTPIKRYSSGMQARLGFSVAAHMDPDVLLVDEVLSVGDMSFQERCLAKMHAFRESGTTVAFVSHNLNAISALCPRSILLSRGRLLFDGPTYEAIARYRTLQEGTASDDRYNEERPATIVSAGFDGLGEHRHLVVRPGDEQTFRMRVRFREDVSGVVFAIILRRISDNLSVYDSSTGDLGAGELSFRAGDEVEATFRMRMNLLRGHYVLACHTRDVPRARFLGYVGSAATIEVDERYSYAGVADLGVQCTVERMGAGA